MLNVLGRKGWLRPVDDAVAIEAEQAVADFRGRVPPVTRPAVEEPVEELLEVVVGPFLVNVVPFLGVVDAEPFEGRRVLSVTRFAHLVKRRTKRTGSMYTIYPLTRKTETP